MDELILKEAPLSFKEFKSYVEKIKDDEEYMDKCNELGLLIFENIWCQCALCDLIDKLFGGDWLGWWIWECNWGKDAVLGEGKRIEGLEELYQVMCEQGGFKWEQTTI